MAPRRASGLTRHDAGWRRLGRAQSIDLGEDRGGLALVASAKLGVVGVRHVTRSVLELELTDGGERHPLFLFELLPAVGR